MNELTDANVLVSPALTPRKKLTKFITLDNVDLYIEEIKRPS